MNIPIQMSFIKHLCGDGLRYVCMPCVGMCLRQSEEGFGSPGAGVTGGYNLSNVGHRNKLGFSTTVVSLVEIANSRFSERPCPKKRDEEGSRHLQCVCMPGHTYLHFHECAMYTSGHTALYKNRCKEVSF